MKKTLFTLLACATVMPAMAENWSFYVARAGVYETYTDADDYTFYLYVDPTKSITSVETMTTTIADMSFSEFTSAAAWSCDFTGKIANRIQAKLSEGEYFTTTIPTNTTADTIWGVCVYHGEAADTAFHVVGKGVEDSSISGFLAPFSSTNGTPYSGFKSSPATPEPATATLSLLALAALASRRKRK